MSTPNPNSTTGLPDNLAGALSYLLGPITGIAFLLMEKKSAFVRFHAMQSTLVGAALIILNFALDILHAVLLRIPLLGWLVSVGLALVVGLASLVLWLALMFMAFSGKEWELPVVGVEARKLLGDTGVALK